MEGRNGRYMNEMEALGGGGGIGDYYFCQQAADIIKDLRYDGSTRC